MIYFPTSSNKAPLPASCSQLDTDASPDPCSLEEAILGAGIDPADPPLDGGLRLGERYGGENKQRRDRESEICMLLWFKLFAEIYLARWLIKCAMFTS